MDSRPIPGSLLEQWVPFPDLGEIGQELDGVGITLGSLAGQLSWLESHPDAPRLQVPCWSGHVEESTRECMSKWDSKLVCLSLSLKINKNHPLKCIKVSQGAGYF